jgi:hypothetical protein
LSWQASGDLGVIGDSLVQPWKLELISAWSVALAEAREDETSWQALAFQPGENAEGHTIDEHLKERARVLWALQYDHGTADSALLRFLLAEEIAWHRESPFQGLGDELSLAAHLVASAPQPGDALVMWAAKQANFDTWCGFDSQYLAAEGVAAAGELARGLNEPRNGSLLDHLLTGEDEVRFSDDDVRAFVDIMSTQFPADPEHEWPVTWVHRARLAEDLPTTIKAIEAWKDSDDPPSSRTLQYEYASAHDYPAAVEAQRIAIAELSDPGSLPGELARLVELERLAGDYGRAVDDLRRGRRALKRVVDDTGYKHRQVAEQGFLLASADPDVGRAKSSFDVAEEASRSVPSLPFVVLTAARDAAARVGDERRRAHWSARADTERARIDRELGRSSSSGA